MSGAYHVAVCGTLVPDPLQTLEPVMGPQGPALRNETLLPSVLDPWAAHALYEAAHLARQHPGSRVWLVSVGPKARLQQLMMSTAQKAPFELVARDGSASGFTDALEVAAVLADAIAGIAGLDRDRLLVFGGCASASRDAGVTLQAVGERLGIEEQFLAVDELRVEDGGALRLKERVEGGQYLVSVCAGPPAVVGWATGNLPEPPNNPQTGMQNMRSVMPALQRAAPVQVGTGGAVYASVAQPQQRRQTRVVRDLPPEQVARELVDWIRG
jgi:electron transfer flavoprotein beta subunit